MKIIRKRVFEIVDITAPADRTSKIFDIFIFSLIILNALAVILETTEWGGGYKSLFYGFELVSVAVFCAEYLLRVWSCVENPDYANSFKGRIRFAFSPMLLVDLAAILPFFIPLIIPFDLRFLRILRLIRIFRVFKLTRYVDDMKIMINVLKNKKEEIFITLFVGSMLLFISSSLMYYAENDAQPENFSSIPNTMWWGVCTLTTVDYGDNIYPVTTLGKFIGSAIAVLGVGLFALPAGILASGFMEEIDKNKAKSSACPHCGKEIKIMNHQTKREDNNGDMQ